MDLHRVEGKPEWERVPAAQRNRSQRLAARTHGVVTFANLISVIGLASIPYGLFLVSQHKNLIGLAVLAAGRLCDLLDGWVADRTVTKSPLGEKIDASFDKISAALVIVGFAVLGVLPIVYVVVLIAPHALIAVLSLGAYSANRPFHPSRPGKLSMAGIWLTLLAALLLDPFDPGQHPASTFGHWTVLGLLTVTTALSITALLGYCRELFSSAKKT